LALPKLPGIAHQRAVKAFEKAGFRTVRQSKHIIMSNGETTIVIPRHDPINAYTRGIIIRNAGLTIEQFVELL
jgi:predicted RNA binding protein YcfA (HicA-like mRNA interferase family)